MNALLSDKTRVSLVRLRLWDLPASENFQPLIATHVSQSPFFISTRDPCILTSLVRILTCWCFVPWVGWKPCYIYTYKYPANITFISSWNFSFELRVLQPFVLGENVFGPKCFLCPFQPDRAEMVNNEVSSRPFINWNEENVMFAKRTRMLRRGKTVCFCAFLCMREPQGAGKRWGFLCSGRGSILFPTVRTAWCMCLNMPSRNADFSFSFCKWEISLCDGHITLLSDTFCANSFGKE